MIYRLFINAEQYSKGMMSRVRQHLFWYANRRKQFLIKLTCARTEISRISVQESVINFKRIVMFYRYFNPYESHIIIQAEEIGDGFAMIFEWVVLRV